MDNTLTHQITGSLDSIGWFLLFLGWLMYWLKGLDELRKANKVFNFALIKDFFTQKVFEILISVLSLLAVAIMSDEIPSTLIDLKGNISLFLAGYASSSILNGLLSYRKKSDS
mgnify:FL=1